MSIQTGSVFKHFLAQHALNTGSYNMSFNMPLTLAFLSPLLATLRALPHHLVVSVHLLHHLLCYQVRQVYKQNKLRQKILIMSTYFLSSLTTENIMLLQFSHKIFIYNWVG
eukprot:TRINITY_DN12348_c0_g1_i2.p1 TRINITY_DN12348_c0_g1~~TRINITY_DN12348_c0_g1_i2.p1  ORF type:complete len:111 (-),score=7.67 TRINITY_DN12348_c0_g1_i2:328-660(-)